MPGLDGVASKRRRRLQKQISSWAFLLIKRGELRRRTSVRCRWEALYQSNARSKKDTPAESRRAFSNSYGQVNPLWIAATSSDGGQPPSPSQPSPSARSTLVLARLEIV